MSLHEDKRWPPTEWCAAAYSNDLDNRLWAPGHGCNHYKSNDQLETKTVEASPYVLDNAWKGIIKLNKTANMSWLDQISTFADKAQLKDWVATRKYWADIQLVERGRAYLYWRGDDEVSDDSDEGLPEKSLAQQNATKLKNSVRQEAREQKAETQKQKDKARKQRRRAKRRERRKKRLREESAARFHGKSAGASPSSSAPGPGNARPTVRQKFGSFLGKCLTCGNCSLYSHPDNSTCVNCKGKNFEWDMRCECGTKYWGAAWRTTQNCGLCGKAYYAAEH
jgi:hypothetical protein